jgi:hypothetical protein
MKIYKKYLNEQASKYKKEFIKDAKEIISNLVKEYKDMLGDPESFKRNVKQLQVSIITIMGTMTQENGSPAYAMYKKYMPKKFNKDLYLPKTGALESSEWMGMSDSMQFTIAREATLQYAKKNGIQINRNDIMIR